MGRRTLSGDSGLAAAAAWRAALAAATCCADLKEPLLLKAPLFPDLQERFKS